MSCSACGPGLEVTAVTPESGAAGQETAITVTGAGFAPEMTLALLDVEGTPISLSSVMVGDARELTATVPSLAAGVYDLRARRGDREAVLEEAFAALGPLRIVILDVGQGDSTLVVSPVGRAMLIDSGPAPAGPHVADVLEAEGVSRLDWLLASHYDADHIGGTRWALAGPDGAVGPADDSAPAAGALLDRGDDTDQTTEVFTDYLALTGSLRALAVAGQVLDLGGGATARIAVVNGDVDGVPPGDDPATRSDFENENSIGVLISIGTFQMLIAGDLTGNPAFSNVVDVETSLGPVVGDLDVYRVNHHGSNTSSIGGFLRDLAPEVSVISVGLDNPFCHPNMIATNRLEQDGGRLFLTSAGIVTPGIFSPAGNECPLTTTYLPADAVTAGGDIVIEVEPEGGAYRVGGVDFPGDGI